MHYPLQHTNKHLNSAPDNTKKDLQMAY